MGIKKKISLGFVVIGAILFVSSLVSVFEFNRIRNTASSLMQANINSISTSRLLLELIDEYNYMLLNKVIQDSTSTSQVVYDGRFDKYISTIKNSLTTSSEKAVADSLNAAYYKYIAVISQAPSIMIRDKDFRREWYDNSLRPVYGKLKEYKVKLGVLTQRAMVENSTTLQNEFYRSIMPGIIAVASGILLVFLFNYFVNIYFISPVLNISKGLRNYRKFNKPYSLHLDGDDEIEDLNSSVKAILEENKSLKKTWN